MCLAQGNNVMPVRLKPAALWSQIKHSTTEPLRSLPGRVEIDKRMTATSGSSWQSTPLKGVKSSISADRQLPGRRLNNEDDAPAPACLSKTR